MSVTARESDSFIRETHQSKMLEFSLLVLQFLNLSLYHPTHPISQFLFTAQQDAYKMYVVVLTHGCTYNNYDCYVRSLYLTKGSPSLQILSIPTLLVNSRCYIIMSYKHENFDYFAVIHDLLLYTILKYILHAFI